MAGRAMAGRFSVIQGGLCEAEAPAAPSATAGWRVDLHRPGGVDDGAVAAWRALMVRGAVDDPLRDPDHLLPLARHRPAGRRVALALAWSRDAAGPETLRGVVPLAMPHPVWGGHAELWRPAGTAGTAGLALIDGTAADAVGTALRARLRALRRPAGLSGSLEAVAAPAPGRLTLVASRPARRAIPADSLVGVRPDGWRPPADAEAETVSEPEAIRDAVESFLALDARTAKAPIVADPSEASLVRVVTRLFARRRACRVEVFRRAGEIVAGTLHLGIGPASVAWRRARA